MAGCRYADGAGISPEAITASHYRKPLLQAITVKTEFVSVRSYARFPLCAGAVKIPAASRPFIVRSITATFLLTLLGCGQGGDTGAASAFATSSAPTVAVAGVPAGIGSASPGLSVGESGTLYLSWQERDADSTLHLRFATRTVADSMWSRVRDVATGTNMLVTATDVPAVHPNLFKWADIFLLSGRTRLAIEFAWPKSKLPDAVSTPVTFCHGNSSVRNRRYV